MNSNASTKDEGENKSYRNVLQRDFSRTFSLKNRLGSNIDDGEEEDSDDPILGSNLNSEKLKHRSDSARNSKNNGKRTVLASKKASKTDYRAKLISFYKENNPGKLDSVDATLAKYKGREGELFRRLKLKYKTSENLLVESEF